MTVKFFLNSLTAAAILACFSMNARAQSSVTLYGELDTGFAYLNNAGGHAQYMTTSGLIDGSYWGLQGAEDLGGGNKAIFRLERGFSVTTGASVNDHPYYVGLASDAYGTVTFGYQYDSVYDYFAPYTLTGGTGGTAFAHPFDNDNANNSYLARNSIKYTSPTLGGFNFGGMVALSNVAGQFANNRAYSVGAHYQNGPFNVGAAYLHNNGRGNTEDGAYDAVMLPGPDRQVFTARVQAQNTYGLGANYVFGDFTLGAAWSRSTYGGVTNADSGDAASSAGFSNYEINGVYQWTKVLSFAAMYSYTKGAGSHWNEGSLQADYQFSTRTDTYLEAVYQSASAGAPAVINSFDPATSRAQLLIAVGIRHRF